jgi:hypothetical protein
MQNAHRVNAVSLLVQATPLPYLWRRIRRLHLKLRYQQLPSAVRRALLIEGDSVVLLDYTAMHSTILYNQAGIPLEGDPYDIAGFPRDEVKLGLNIAYNAKTPHAARSALALKLAEQDGRQVTSSDHARAAQILAALREKHPGIASAFGSDNGAGLQYRDSEIIREVTAKCAREGIAALSVHDEMIVPAKYEGRVSELMVQTFAEREPGPNAATIRASGDYQGASGDAGRETLSGGGSSRCNNVPFTEAETAVLGHYALGEWYLRCVEGAPRIDLEGKVVGTLTAQEATDSDGPGVR